jgi:hypothetical protein
MPRDYAKRFADLIVLDPDIAADYAIQLNDMPFACEVALELEKMGIPAQVNDVTGLLTISLPEDHPKAAESNEKQRGFGKGWLRPGDGTSSWRPDLAFGA